MTKLPEKFWHCFVRVRERDRKYTPVRVVNDLTIEQLDMNVVKPWRHRRTFNVGGFIVGRDDDQVIEIRIVQTPHPQQYYADEHKASNVDNPLLIPFWPGKGTDHTSELLFVGDDFAAPVPTADASLIRRICERLPYAASILGDRSRGKPPYTIEDEYDVQDLLHAVIRAYVKHSVQEDPMGKVAGTLGGRADISIEDLGILIEVKYVRLPSDTKRVVKEFSQDLLLYAKWEPLLTLILLIYNSAVLKDREALDKLTDRVSIGEKTFDVYVVLA